MHLSTITRYLGLSLLLASLLPAQEQVRAVAPAHAPSNGNRFLSPGVDAGDYLYISGQGPRRTDGTVPSASRRAIPASPRQRQGCPGVCGIDSGKRSVCAGLSDEHQFISGDESSI